MELLIDATAFVFAFACGLATVFIMVLVCFGFFSVVMELLVVE